MLFFFFKQKTAYERRISDWSSDVCSSDLPLNVPDFASYLLQAQSSKAQVVALANGGADVVNAIKQAREFGIVAGGQRLASLLIFLSDLRALGLENAQGLTYVDRSEEHTSELQSLMRNSYAVFCFKTK